MPKDIHKLIDDNLMTPLKKYKTSVQDTILRVAGDRLQTAYDLTEAYTDTILNPGNLRPDIVYAKAKQYGFEIRPEASLSEQVNLLKAINVIYGNRGSRESIENLWKYYGGDLPRKLNIENPSQNLFIYSKSKFSGDDVFQDSDYYRPGIYSVSIEGDYDVNKLKEFLNKELVAAGTSLAFIQRSFPMYMDITNSDLRSDTVYKRYSIERTTLVPMDISGLVWSTFSDSPSWSGKLNLFVDITRVLDLNPVYVGDIDVDLVKMITKPAIRVGVVSDRLFTEVYRYIIEKTIGTFYNDEFNKNSHFCNVNGNEINSYPGYFILGKSLLSQSIN